jgi:hypothetical protein
MSTPGFEFTVRGAAWSDPSAPEHKAPGHLLVNDLSSLLTLEHGTIGDNGAIGEDGTLRQPQMEWPALYGRDVVGRKFTLLDCDVLEALWPEKQKILGATAICGVHVPSKDTAGVEIAWFNIDGLSAWLESAPDDGLPEAPQWFDRRYPVFTGVSGPHGSTLRLTVQADTTYQHKAAVVGQLRTLTPYIKVEFETPVSVVQLIDLINQVAGLVTVATLVPCAPRRVEGIWMSEGPWGREESGFSMVTPATLAPEPNLRPPVEKYLLPAEHVQELFTSWLAPERTKKNLRRAATMAADVFGALRLSPFIRVNTAVSDSRGHARQLQARPRAA